MISAIPDWKPGQTVLWVWPEDLPRRSHLCGVYEKLIERTPGHASVVLLVKGKERANSLQSELTDKYPGLKLKTIWSPFIRDIWIRDYGFFPIQYFRDVHELVQFQYAPSYITKPYQAKAHNDSLAAIQAASNLGITLKMIPIALDGGSLIHNGNGIAVLTQKAVDHAVSLSRQTAESVKAILRTNLGFKKIIVVKPEPGDVTGHMDGIVRFLTPNTLSVIKYPNSYREGYEYGQYLTSYLATALGAKFKIVKIPCSPPLPVSCEGIPSAVGNYLNFVWIGERLIVPQYGTELDREVIQRLRSALPQTEIIGFLADLTIKLASLGGILNCITTTIPTVSIMP